MVSSKRCINRTLKRYLLVKRHKRGADVYCAGLIDPVPVPVPLEHSSCYSLSLLSFRRVTKIIFFFSHRWWIAIDVTSKSITADYLIDFLWFSYTVMSNFVGSFDLLRGHLVQQPKFESDSDSLDHLSKWTIKDWQVRKTSGTELRNRCSTWKNYEMTPFFYRSLSNPEWNNRKLIERINLKYFNVLQGSWGSATWKGHIPSSSIPLWGLAIDPVNSLFLYKKSNI